MSIDYGKIEKFAKIYSQMSAARIQQLIDEGAERYLNGPQLWTTNDKDHQTALQTALHRKESTG